MLMARCQQWMDRLNPVVGLVRIKSKDQIAKGWDNDMNMDDDKNMMDNFLNDRETWDPLDSKLVAWSIGIAIGGILILAWLISTYILTS